MIDTYKLQMKIISGKIVKHVHSRKLSINESYEKIGLIYKIIEPFFFGNEISNLKKILKDKWISSGGKAVKFLKNC